jgi:predicted nuclease of predicted toxin-antitoxin system
MKLLFDQHFSFRTVKGLDDLFPDARHLRFFNLVHASDSEIWDFARTEGFTIITKDSDFHQRSLTFGHPPKVVWLRCGNLPRAELEAFIRKNAALLRDFIREEGKSLLVLG